MLGGHSARQTNEGNGAKKQCNTQQELDQEVGIQAREETEAEIRN